MIRREQGWSFHGPQDDLWRVKFCPTNGQMYVRGLFFFSERLTELSCRYVNTITGEYQLDPPTAFRGGILGDTMGLGKSLTIISLIANDKEYADRSNLGSENSCRCTLIVVRAPCKRD